MFLKKQITKAGYMIYEQKNSLLYIIKNLYFYFNKKEILVSFLIFLFLSACISPMYKKQQGTSYSPQSSGDKPIKISKPYTVMGKTYYPHQKIQPYREVGIASWYGEKFHGRPTATGEIYNMYQVSAAHKILPLNTKVQVTNLENGRKIILRINDRGPFVKDRIIDLSYAAANKLGVIEKGTAKVVVETLGNWSKNTPGKYYIQMNSFSQKQNALKYKQELHQQGFEHVRLKSINVGLQTFWRVQLGAYPTYEQAQQILQGIPYRKSENFVISD